MLRRVLLGHSKETSLKEENYKKGESTLFEENPWGQLYLLEWTGIPMMSWDSIRNHS